MLTGAFVSAAIAMELPGPGTIYLGQNLQFRAPVLLGDTVTVYLEVIEKHDTKPWLKLSTTVKNQDDKEIMTLMYLDYSHHLQPSHLEFS